MHVHPNDSVVRNFNGNCCEFLFIVLRMHVCRAKQLSLKSWSSYQLGDRFTLTLQDTDKYVLHHEWLDQIRNVIGESGQVENATYVSLLKQH